MNKDRYEATKAERRQRATDIARGIEADPTVLAHAVLAVERLVDEGSYVADTKVQFAARMGWYDANDKPNASLVHQVCALTKDQFHLKGAEDLLGGMVIAYSAQIGGITLIDPDGDLSVAMLVHIVTGDLQQQQNFKTINRRRVPTWRQASVSLGKQGFGQLSRLFAQAENEVDSLGVVSDSIAGKIWKTVREMGLVDG